jgi:hypothetical protein
VHPHIIAIRKYQAEVDRLNAPPEPEQPDVAADVVPEAQAVAKPKKVTEISRAVAFLREVLKTGPIPETKVQDLARDAKISARTLKRAKAKAKVVSSRTGRDYWVWRLSVVKAKEDQKP